MLRPSLTDAAPEPVFERIPAQQIDLGGFQVTRALPSHLRRSVGPFVFLDAFASGEDLMNVGSHPHIGIATLTWLTSGRLMHHDSLGSEQPVGPREVSLMTAGRGLCHTETGLEGPMTGVQLWVALPPDQRRCTPGYHHYEDLPFVEEPGGRVTVVVGSFQGYRSPVKTWQDTVLYDCEVEGTLEVSCAYELEHGLLVLDGEVTVDGESVEGFVYLGMRGYGVTLEGKGRVLVLGGAPIEQPYILWWNFLDDDPDRIAWARDAWNSDDGEFGEIKGARRLPAPTLPGSGA